MDAASDGAATDAGPDTGDNTTSDASEDAPSEAGCVASDVCCAASQGSACPLMGEDPNQDGVKSGSESWSGSCDGSGRCAECAVDADCGTCMRCNSGLCGMAQAGTSCGTCHQCDAAGACQPADSHDDCGTCQMCQNGACVNQPDGAALKNDCPLLDCTQIVAGWGTQGSTTDCERFTSTDAASNGKCAGNGSCYSYAAICSGRANDLGSCHGQCLQACPAGAPISNYDEAGERCLTDWSQKCGPGSLVCGFDGTCLEPCSDNLACSSKSLGCCSPASPGSACLASDTTCFCANDCGG